MPTRVKVVLRKGDKEIATSALLNTGFTSDQLDVLLPKKLAEVIGLWPPPEGSRIESLDTAGGEVMAYTIPNALRLTVDAGDRRSKEVTCNVVVSLHEKEVLLSDAVIEELGIHIISPRKGIWRFKDDVKDRKSVECEEWR